MSEYAEDFCASMGEISDGGRKRRWEIFGDFCELSYTAIAKQWQHVDRRERLEKRYKKVSDRYNLDQLEEFGKMLGWTIMSVSKDGRDFLGPIYEAEGFCDRKYGAQFFTPEDLAELLALGTFDTKKKIGHDGKVMKLMDPCVGSGRLLLAAARVYKKNGANIQKHIWMDATDLDIVCMQMTYLQLSFAGIPGVVRHGDALSEDKFDWALTPSGVLLLNANESFRDSFKPEPPKVAPFNPGVET